MSEVRIAVTSSVDSSNAETHFLRNSGLKVSLGREDDLKALSASAESRDVDTPLRILVVRGEGFCWL